MTEFHVEDSTVPKARQFSLKRTLQKWPLLVWVGVLGISLIVYQKISTLNRLYGEVDAFQVSVAPSQKGRLAELLVGVGDQVAAGQAVARMESDEVDRKETKLLKQLEMRRSELVAKHLKEISGLERDIRKEEIDVAGLKTENATIVEQIQALEDLLSKGEQGSQLVPRPAPVKTEDLLKRISELKPDLSRNQAKLEQSGNKIVSREADIQQKKDQLIQLKKSQLTKLADLEEKFELDSLDEERKSLLLKASQPGKVSSVKKVIGEFVDGGETVLEIQADSKRVKACLPEKRAGELKRDDVVWVASMANPKVCYRSKVINVESEIKTLPVEGGRFKRADLRGQYILIDCPPDAALLGGQKVLVFLDEPDTTATSQKELPR